MELPPGFRFHPTDEEIIIHYLSKKVVNSSFAAIAIAQIEVNKCEPWDLAKRSKIGGSKECYFFCELGPKYSTGIRTNRATDAGYWKSTGKDKEIRRENIILGMKKTLVFYRGRAPKGEKTQWIMYEYRLDGSYEKNKWVICRVFEKSLPGQEKRAFGQAKIGPLSSMFEEEMAQGVPQPPLMDAQVASFPNSLIYEGVAFNFSAGGASASSSFYGGNVIGDKFMTSAVSNPQETGTALNTDVSSGNDVARNSFEDLWNC